MHIDFSWQLLPEFAIVGLAAVVLCAALIVAMMPLPATHKSNWPTFEEAADFLSVLVDIGACGVLATATGEGVVVVVAPCCHTRT